MEFSEDLEIIDEKAKSSQIIRDGDLHHLVFLEEIISKFGDKHFIESYGPYMGKLLNDHLDTAIKIANHEKLIDHFMVKSALPLLAYILSVAVYSYSNQLNSVQKEFIIITMAPLLIYFIGYLVRAYSTKVNNFPSYTRLFELKQNVYGYLNLKDETGLIEDEISIQDHTQELPTAHAQLNQK